jgi:hypothetical protein
VSDVAALVQQCKDAGIPIGIEELIFIVSRLGRSFRHFVPTEVADFVARLVEPYSPKTVLDPWAGMGLLTIPVKDRLNADFFEAYTVIQSDVDVWQLLDGAAGITLHVGDALRALQESSSEFDAVTVPFLPTPKRSDPWKPIRLDSRPQALGLQKGCPVLPNHRMLSQLLRGLSVLPNGAEVGLSQISSSHSVQPSSLRASRVRRT